MSYYNGNDTWKVVYTLPPRLVNNGARGVALVEASSRAHAMSVFQQEYAGQFFTVESCKLLIE